MEGIPNERAQRDRERDVLFGKRMAEIRDHAGLSQAEAARLTGISQSKIAKFETGVRRVPVFDVIELAKVYGVSLDAFVLDSFTDGIKTFVPEGPVALHVLFRPILRKSVDILIGELLEVLGARLVGAIAGASEDVLRSWLAYDDAPTRETTRRLRLALRIVRAVNQRDGKDVARAWMIEPWPGLDSVQPYVVLRDQPSEVASALLLDEATRYLSNPRHF